MSYSETPEQAERRRAADLHDFRVLAWLVIRNRYNREALRFQGGRRGSVRTVTAMFHSDAADWHEADQAVREIEARRPDG